MSLSVTYRRDAMRMREPFRISGYLLHAMPATVVTVGDGTHFGRGEAAGVYYLNDDPPHMEREIERVRDALEAGVDRQGLQSLLPPGGARNALDCALWELESLKKATPVWRLAGVPEPKPQVTTFTLPADDPAEILRRLEAFTSATSIKLKLEGDLAADTERVRAVRRARPDVWLSVDANQGFGAKDLEPLAAMLVDKDVALLEQPVRRGSEQLLDGWDAPLPVAADESILDLKELREQYRRFDIVNIKLDKCGGLTEALAMAAEARRLGLGVMVGNMAGSVLAAAPGFVLAQLCDVVDLDGPYFLAEPGADRGIFNAGKVMISPDFWGWGNPSSA
ncbi:muconate cycloisomerase [Nitrospirillum viridazoti Y2]|uniref:Dipeptide epimerase n=1 Tax=Nitrospirillum amazonense TaxID=28077 RepID=A0A560ICC3_9PROT|nr:dipeptide epimerase [Nitrospirillum amazonense]EGY01282.1 muconate cycloisomerase [Nitrospirillum amazonense Y2]TWB56702.1 L-alanine-DL-glutamate epimerase-like enolase superfamily enzyme [Nitrospirillum amazonense]